MKDHREADDNILHSMRSVSLGRIAITASVIGILLAGYLFFSGRPGDWQDTAVPVVETRKTPPSAKFWTNTSGRDSVIQLPDGSTAKLGADSRLSFQPDATRAIRRVLLTGEAFFDVAPDRSKPFTVFSGEVSITALGTQFIVSDRGGWALSVKAFQGKAKINTHPDEPDRMKTYYLIPGNELVYDKQRGVARLLLFNEGPNKKHQLAGSKHAGAQRAGAFLFNSSSLAETLDQLSAVYGKPILYSREQLQGAPLIGKIDPSHPLDGILKNVAAQNALDVREENDGYRVEKR